MQRVSKASVYISENVYSSINEGLLILLGIDSSDCEDDIFWLTKKITSLRIFSDQYGKMNSSVIDVNRDILVVSQFTLQASTKKGSRPSFIRAAKPALAMPLYERFIKELSCLTNKKVKSGRFGEYMKVELINDGPVTIIMDSKDRSF